MRGVAATLLVVIVAVAANDCPSDWSHDQLLVHEDCNKFYICTYGEPVAMPCWGDLLFNVETGQCDWQANVDCGDRNIPGLEPETTPESETEPTTTEPETEPTATEPTTTEPETEPTTAELETDPTTTEPETEPTTTEAEPEPTTTEAETEPTTTEPETKPTTTEPETEPITAEPTTEEPSTPQPSFLENGCPVDPHTHWLLPVEGDCNGFYYCVWGELVLTACPPTLHFNKEIQVCDWPANAGCTTSLNKHNIGQYSQR